VIRTPFRSLGYLSASHDIPQRFRPNPYRDDPSDVLYYTGDLGQYRLDGTVDILVRCDNQVKIRGVRVEPQEVATVLHTCPKEQGCTVLGQPDLKEGMALTAYVVVYPDTSLSGLDLRTFLSARIHMRLYRRNMYCWNIYRSPPMARSTGKPYKASLPRPSYK
jgi:acyl-coenzyme A synthetase/AMP-(fatty) acid ligase